MRRVAVVILYVLAIIYLALIFLPKKELFFLGESYLEKYKIVLSNEDHSDYGVAFKVSGGTLYYDRVKAFDLNSITLTTLLFYNSLSMSEFELDSSFASLFPAKIESLSVRHTLFYPHVLFLEGFGEFGKLTGKIDLMSRKISISVEAPSTVVTKYRQLFMQMKKSEKGFDYESSF